MRCFDYCLLVVLSQFVDAPAASTPRAALMWKDTKAIHRLLDCPDVNLQNVTQTHRDRVQQRSGTQLILSDATHVEFGRGRYVDGAEPGKSVSILLHSALACFGRNVSNQELAISIKQGRKSLFARYLGRVCSMLSGNVEQIGNSIHP